MVAYFSHLIKAMDLYEINKPLRAAAFLAQLAHESGEFRWMEEIWGRNGGTAQQKRYEPPSSLAKALGNTEKGDGYRYRGRGVIMITGRFNYRKYGDLLGVDLVANPDLAAKPEYAFQIAGAYWRQRGLNELADGGTDEDFKDITIRINGGTTNLADRQRYYAVAKKVLGVAT
jgi:predicted chitinase